MLLPESSSLNESVLLKNKPTVSVSGSDQRTP